MPMIAATVIAHTQNGTSMHLPPGTPSDLAGRSVSSGGLSRPPGATGPPKIHGDLVLTTGPLGILPSRPHRHARHRPHTVWYMVCNGSGSGIVPRSGELLLLSPQGADDA